MAFPCEECIVYAVCKQKHSEENCTIECELLWNYVVEETSGSSVMKIWLTSTERRVRKKRYSKFKEMFPVARDLGWMGDIL